MLATIDKGNGKLEDGFFNFTYQAILDSYGNIEGIVVFAVEVTQYVIARKEDEEITRYGQLNVPNANYW